jgi:hypothetical protein
VNDTPLLFRGEMIRALLDGKKTVTRRIINKRNSLVDGLSPKGWWNGLDFTRAWIDPGPSPSGNDGPYLKVPRIADGDEYVHRVYPRLWAYDRIWVKETFAPNAFTGGRPCYRASFVPEPHVETPKWKPSIFMPRSASRLTLEVVSVRPERVQDITEDDARAEGVSSREEFESLWTKINGKTAPWASNPWCWRLAFRIVYVPRRMLAVD